MLFTIVSPKSLETFLFNSVNSYIKFEGRCSIVYSFSPSVDQCLVVCCHASVIQAKRKMFLPDQKKPPKTKKKTNPETLRLVNVEYLFQCIKLLKAKISMII